MFYYSVALVYNEVLVSQLSVYLTSIIFFTDAKSPDLSLTK